jgi:hypothetical protein
MILNLTQHQATADQLAAGVVDCQHPLIRKEVAEALTFTWRPSAEEVERRAKRIAGLAAEERHIVAAGRTPETAYYSRAMIGGAPFLMAPLEKALWALGIVPVYAFSLRDSAEETQPDGSVRKVNTFRHAGFVEPDPPRVL